MSGFQVLGSGFKVRERGGSSVEGGVEEARYCSAGDAELRDRPLVLRHPLEQPLLVPGPSPLVSVCAHECMGARVHVRMCARVNVCVPWAARGRQVREGGEALLGSLLQAQRRAGERVPRGAQCLPLPLSLCSPCFAATLHPSPHHCHNLSLPHCQAPLALLCVAHSVSTPPPHSLFPFPPSPPRLAVAPCLCAQFFKDRHYLHHEWALFLRGDAGAGRAAEAGTEGGKEGGAEGGGGEARAGDAGAGAGSAGGGGGCGGGREGCVCERCVAIRRVVLEVGCGAGNTVFPLLADDPHLFALACDFSPRAGPHTSM
ncbi:unnamed protein product [Closterium sp. Naga37s-1]|nr:unnamed protein product [Closterium sp. Naga37s-1]